MTALSEHLRDRAAQPDSAAGHRRPGPHLLLRRRFPAQGAARRPVRSALRRRGRTRSPTPATTCCSPSLTVGGEGKKFYRYQSPDDSIVDYYDDSGKSAKKFLVRKPVTDGIMRSAFGIRRHPILGYTKMHTGVDWAAPTGTPIYASGNGTIEKAGWESATANTSASSTTTATRPPMAT